LELQSIMKSFNHYITELFEKPYKWTLRDKHSRADIRIIGSKDTRYYFKTDDGETMVVRFRISRTTSKSSPGDSSKDLYRTSVDFFNDKAFNTGRHKMTGLGDAMKIMSTVLDIIKDSIKKMDYDEIRFSADKAEGEETTGRVKLYRTMVKKFANKMGYKSKEEDEGKDIGFTLTKK